MQETSDRDYTYGTMVVVSGPSGAGKTSVCRDVLEADARLHFSVSCTTRPPRDGEVDGRDYTFLRPDEFDRRVASGCFLEHAEVHGHLYGTLREEVERSVLQGRDVLLDIDVQGARQVRERARGTRLGECAVFVFLGPPSVAEMERRLRDRRTDSAAVIARRLANARVELPTWREYDYLVVNDELPLAVHRLQAVLDAARCAVSRTRVAPWE